MHDSCLLYLKRGVVLRVISSCAQVPRGCYTPYTAVLSATTPCTLVDVDAGAAANRIMRNSWLHCILFHIRLPTGNRYPIYTVILQYRDYYAMARSRIRYLRQGRLMCGPHRYCMENATRIPPTVYDICTWHIGPVNSPPIGLACCLAHSFAFARSGLSDLCRWVTDCLDLRPQKPKLFCTSSVI